MRSPLGIDDAGWLRIKAKRGYLFGCHLESHTIIVVTPKPERKQNITFKIRTLVKEAGGDESAVLLVEA